MILNFKEPRLYICLYVSKDGEIKSFKFSPGDNKIPNSEAKFLLKHPGIKNRLDLGILVEKKTMTEDLAKEAKEASEVKKAKEASKESKTSENHNANKKAEKAEK